MLRLQRLVREPAAETLPIPEGRRAILRQSALVGRRPADRRRPRPAGRRPPGPAVRPDRRAGRRLHRPHRLGPLLLFFHGGGWMYGDLDSHDAACRFLAERSGVRVLAVDYRLAPEHPFPAAYEDALEAYRWVVKNAESIGADPERLAVGGDSAGGCLAATTAIAAARGGAAAGVPAARLPRHRHARRQREPRAVRRGLLPDQAVHGPRRARCYIARPGAADATRGSPRCTPTCPPGSRRRTSSPPASTRCATRARRTPAGWPTPASQVELERFPDQIHGFFNVVGAGRTRPRGQRGDRRPSCARRSRRRHGQ